MIASLFQFVFLGAGDEIAAAAATRAIKGGESVIELEAAAAAEIERGRGRETGRGTRIGKKRRSATRTATGTGVVNANARASLVVHPPLTTLPRLRLRPPRPPPPLLKTTSLPRGAKSCGLGPPNSRFLQLA
jgi:hypothetical protein